MLEHDPQLSSEPRAAAAAEARPRAAGEGVDWEWLEAQLGRLELLLCTPAAPAAVARQLLLELAPLAGAVRGAAYVVDSGAEDARVTLCASYAAGDCVAPSFALGEGLIGQCALDREKRVLSVPSEHLRVRSGLGASDAATLAIVPVRLEGSALSVLELAFFGPLGASAELLLERLAARRGSAAAPAEHAGSAPPSCPQGLWGKLSHELRSPLNSVLVLSKLLAENAEKNLSPKQIAFAQAIHSSGSELLNRVNAIGDLAKLESGRLVLQPRRLAFEALGASLERAFEPIARGRGLAFSIELERGLPDGFVTDGKRLRQILHCLLSNAFKFTVSGGVAVNVGLRPLAPGAAPRLGLAGRAVAFTVRDTGVGMTSAEVSAALEAPLPSWLDARRGAGPRGLGLIISRELARLLGGQLRGEGEPELGCTFTLLLPQTATAGEMLPAIEDPLAHPAGWRAELRSSAPPPPPDAEGIDPTQLLGLHVLLVDEDVLRAFALAAALERRGAVVSHADTLGEAVARLGESAPRAVVVAAELLEAPRSEHALACLLEPERRLPFVALSHDLERPVTGGRALPAHALRLHGAGPGELAAALRGMALGARSEQC